MLSAVLALFAAQERPELVLSGEPLPPGAVARFGVPHRPFPNPYYPFAAGYSDEGSFRVAVPDGKDARVWTWHAPGVQPPKHLFHSHSKAVNRLALSPDGRTLATGDEGGVRVWDLATGDELLALEDEPADGVLAVGPRGRLVFRAGAAGYAVWETTTKKRLAFGSDDTRAFVCAAFAPGGKALVTADAAGKLEVWEARAMKRVGELAWTAPPAPKDRGPRFGPKLGPGGTPEFPRADARQVVDPVSPEHDGGVIRIAFSADGARVITAGATAVRAWDVATRKELWRSSHSHYFTTAGSATVWTRDGGKLSGADLSTDGKFVATADVSGTLRLIDAATGKDVWAKRGAAPVELYGRGSGVAFHPNGRSLAVHNAGNCADLFDVRTGARLATTGGHTGAASGVAFSPDGKHLAGFGEDGNIDVYDVAARRLVARARVLGGNGAGLSFTADGKYVVTGAAYVGRFGVAEFVRGARPVLRPLGEPGYYGTAAAVCVDPRAPARVVAAANGGVVRGEDVPTRTGIVYGDGTEKTCIRLDETPYQIALAPAANRLVVGSGSYGKRARVFDLKTGGEPITLADDAPASGVAVTPDGKLIAAIGRSGLGGHGPRELRIWDGATGKRLHLLEFGADDHGGGPAFSPDGKLVGCGAGDAVVLVDVASGKEVARAKGHRGTAWGVAFSPDGERIASCADDGQTLLWDVAALLAANP